MKPETPRYATHPAVALRLEHPDWFQTQIARELGISRKRVSQVLIRAGVTTRPVFDRHFCQDCGRVLYRHAKTDRCHACQVKHNTVILTCDTCGKTFPRRLRYVEAAKKHGARHIWCGRHCQYKWLGQQNIGRKG